MVVGREWCKLVYNYQLFKPFINCQIKYLIKTFPHLRRPDDRLSIPEREPRSNEPTDLRVPPGIPPWELDGIAGNKVGGFVFVRHAFRHVYKFVIHCLSLHLFACQSFKFRCNVGIHYAFQARALSPDYIINL